MGGLSPSTLKSWGAQAPLAPLYLRPPESMGVASFAASSLLFSLKKKFFVLVSVLLVKFMYEIFSPAV